VWNDWTDPATGELIPSYTMLTQNCDAHPLLNRMHKPDPALPAQSQDKRSVIPIEREHWELWLNGSVEEAMALVRLPAPELFAHGPAEPALQASLSLLNEIS
jgi:putative SOS response-associated peptidase YedK